MTECNSPSVVFSSLARRPVVADFDGGTIVSDAGALLLREVDRKLGLIDKLDAVIPDPRSQALITHRQVTMLRQRVFAIALGYEDGNDHQTLRDDPLMQLVSERGIDPDQPLASPPTICRLENRVGRRTLSEIAQLLVEVFIASQPERPSNWSSTSTPPTTPCTATRSTASSKGITTSTASCRCTCSAGTTCWWRTCGRPTSTRPNTRGRSCRCWSGGCAKCGRA